MLDKTLSNHLTSPLNKIALLIKRKNISANQLTAAGFCANLCVFAMLLNAHYALALAFLAASRLLDGLDGARARLDDIKGTAKGAYIDILSDFILYSGFIFCFMLGGNFPNTSETYTLPYISAAFCLAALYINAASFFAAALIADKNSDSINKGDKKKDEAPPPKSKISSAPISRKFFHFSAGLCEGTETIFFMFFCCVFPAYFMQACLVFGSLCLLTAFLRTIDIFKKS